MVDPLFDWSDNIRSSGILLHPTSLPNQYQIGNFGFSARSFVDILVKSGMRYWQMLPLGPTGYGNSPYQSYSSYAINPYLIDWDELIDLGWIQMEELTPLHLENAGEVNFEVIRRLHPLPRKKAMTHGLADKRFKDEFVEFKKRNSHWLDDYTFFMALKRMNKGKPWIKWKKEHRDYDMAKSTVVTSEDLLREVECLAFEQFILHRQWSGLKDYANSCGIEIVGDIPIYVSYDSVDVWANRAVFQLNKSGSATKLAGVPPDYFNENGQFWGNPLYNWKYLKENGFSWWIERLKHTLRLFDIVRFDHFRALAAYWSIPAKAKTAKEGKWVKGPGVEFFMELKKQLPDARLIVEDLGEITPDVIALKQKTGYPGLAVLQFAFGGKSDNFYLPHNIDRNTVVYTGTHDNDTSLGWYHAADEKTRDHLRRYLQVPGSDVPWDLIRSAYRSTARICIVVVQDILALDSDARMNVPGVATGNWAWRMSHSQMFHLGNTSADYLKSLAVLYGRL